jgi:hypothetical protein
VKDAVRLMHTAAPRSGALYLHMRKTLQQQDAREKILGPRLLGVLT